MTRATYAFALPVETTSSSEGTSGGTAMALTITGSPKAGEGAMSSKLGTTKRSDGTVQVTYAGHPLYTYVADKKAGD